MMNPMPLEERFLAGDFLQGSNRPILGFGDQTIVTTRYLDRCRKTEELASILFCGQCSGSPLPFSVYLKR